MGRTDFPDCDMLDAMIASALKRLVDKHIRFRKKVSVEEQRAQKYDRFLRGRHIAHMIYEHFRATGAYEAAKGRSTLFSIRLPNDDVQDFDVRWDHALLSVSEMPSDPILEGILSSPREFAEFGIIFLRIGTPGNTGNIMEHGGGVRREPESSSIPTPLSNQSMGTLNPLCHIGGTYAHNGVMDYPWCPIRKCF